MCLYHWQNWRVHCIWQNLLLTRDKLLYTRHIQWQKTDFQVVNVYGLIFLHMQQFSCRVLVRWKNPSGWLSSGMRMSGWNYQWQQLPVCRKYLLWIIMESAVSVVLSNHSIRVSCISISLRCVNNGYMTRKWKIVDIQHWWNNWSLFDKHGDCGNCSLICQFYK